MNRNDIAGLIAGDHFEFHRGTQMTLGPAAGRPSLRRATLGAENADRAILDRLATFPGAGIRNRFNDLT